MYASCRITDFLDKVGQVSCAQVTRGKVQASHHVFLTLDVLDHCWICLLGELKASQRDYRLTALRFLVPLHVQVHFWLNLVSNNVVKLQFSINCANFSDCIEVNTTVPKSAHSHIIMKSHPKVQHILL